MTVAELLEQWERDAATLRRRGATVQGDTLAQCCEELRIARRAELEELLTLTQVAQLSGYSKDYLRELLYTGTIPNAGRKNAPRIRRRDVPRKAPPMKVKGPDLTGEAA